MNKNTKIWANYMLGIAISLVLLWSIKMQAGRQLATINADTWNHTGWNGYLAASIVLMILNQVLETGKWYLLCRMIAPLTFAKALRSYLAGIAVALVTPNRIGDYPARILYLGGKSTFRYISVAVLGIMAQLSAIFLFGLAGLIYYNSVFPSFAAKMVLAGCAIANVLLIIGYWRFRLWLPALARMPRLRRFAAYGRLLARFSSAAQLRVLLISVARFGIFTAQYLFLLRWMNVSVPLVDGFWTAALFFWAMAVIPSIAFTGVIIRTKVSMMLFGHFSANTVGIVAATVGIWILNLAVPAIIGSILMIRTRLLLMVKE
ncbi:MAG: lysylphosphatidylglycerol synthase transmembrane domain-containing protein [Bacteroidota bacterium]